MATQPKKSDQLAGMQTVRKALFAHYKKKTLQLAGEPVKADDAIAQLDAQIARIEAVDEAKRQYRNVVREQNDAAGEGRGLVRGIQKYVGATEGETSKTYADFGFSPRKPGKAKVETKAQAVAKTKATRTARHIMGKKQRQKIRATTASSAAPSPTNASLVVAAPSGVTMTASTAPTTNGVAHGNGVA